MAYSDGAGGGWPTARGRDRGCCAVHDEDGLTEKQDASARGRKRGEREGGGIKKYLQLDPMHDMAVTWHI